MPVAAVPGRAAVRRAVTVGWFWAVTVALWVLAVAGTLWAWARESRRVGRFCATLDEIEALAWERYWTSEDSHRDP